MDVSKGNTSRTVMSLKVDLLICQIGTGNSENLAIYAGLIL